MNDTMLVTGSCAGMVKLWDLKTVLKYDKDSEGVKRIPLRKITMKGVMHYPIKTISQFTYLDLVIVAKYEAKKKKDKIKIVEIKG